MLGSQSDALSTQYALCYRQFVMCEGWEAVTQGSHSTVSSRPSGCCFETTFQDVTIPTLRLPASSKFRSS